MVGGGSVATVIAAPRQIAHEPGAIAHKMPLLQFDRQAARSDSIGGQLNIGVQVTQMVLLADNLGRLPLSQCRRQYRDGLPRLIGISRPGRRIEKYLALRYLAVARRSLCL